MNRIEIFQVLGIEETKDERALKAAYRQRLSAVNPEDDPEGFKRLRTAYEEACRLARWNTPRRCGYPGNAPLKRRSAGSRFRDRKSVV